MPNINDAFPSKFMKASDLQGTEPIVTIDRVDFEPVGRDREMKAVLYFAGKTKGLVLNKTNATKISQLVGSDLTEEWTGQRVRLYATETTFGGDTVDCVRIKPAVIAAPRQRPAPLPPPPVEPPSDLTDDDIPF